MPFTPTHIAAILPVTFLSRNWLPFSALAIGSMIPDIQLFVPHWMVFNYLYNNSIPGIFLICVPLGMTLFLWYQCYAKEPLMELLPNWIRQRVHPHDQTHIESNFGFFVRVAVAIMIGAATHIFWDSFTHYGHWGYQRFPDMNRIVFQWGDYSLERYKAIQHGSTIVLAPVMVWVAWMWLQRREPAGEVHSILSRKTRIGWSAAILLLPNVLALLWCGLLWNSFYSIGHFAREAVTTAGFIFFLLINFYAYHVHEMPEFKRTLEIT